YNVNTNEFAGSVELSGFSAKPSSVYMYTFTLTYKNASFNETVQNMTTFNRGFSILGSSPNLPIRMVRPSSNQSFSLSIKLPNAPYKGTLNITVLYYMYRNNTP
ncbi:MAG: hypothetical protein ACP5MZ_03515, partial [Candidatus Micrarchaeia archaeon]